MSNKHKEKSFSKCDSDEKLDRLYNMLCNVQSVVKQSNDDIKKLGKRVQAVDLRVDRIEQKVKSVEKKTDNTDGEIKQLKSTINELQQAKLECDMIIHGVPEIESDEQSLLTVVEIIIGQLNCDKPYNILSIYRLGKANDTSKKSKPRPINVQFEHKNQKATVLKAKKKVEISCDKIKLEDKSIGKSNQLIYFDERLTKETSFLYYNARQLRKQQLLKQAFILNGNLFVRETEDSEAIRIRNREQLFLYKKDNKSNSTKNDEFDIENGGTLSDSADESIEDNDEEADDSTYSPAQKKKQGAKRGNRGGRNTRTNRGGK